jgi:uncharacterized repeat protein (TIGR01451 family)
MPPRAACQADRCFVRRFFFLSTKSGNSEELVRLICPRLKAITLQTRVLMAFSALVLVGTTVLGFAAKDWPIGGWREKPATFVSSRTATNSPSQQQVFANLPLIFESNQGQTDSQVKFLSRGSGYGLFLTANEAVLTLQHSAPSTEHSAGQVSVLRMALDGANADAQILGTDPLPGKSNYLMGNDPSKWHRNVPQFAQVHYDNVYPGIDLVYYGNQGRVEYDFKVAPGADPKQIALRFRGSERLELTSTGDLVLATAAGDVRLEAPRVYQEIGEARRPVAGTFTLRDRNRVGFELGAYDRSRALIIDPVLSYSTYLGGSGNEGCTAISGSVKSGCPAIAVDSAGNAYVAGTTTSADFPPSGTPFQATLNAVADIFIAKFNSTGSALIFSTYLGGSGTDTSAGVGADSGFNVIVAGTTNSADFPTNGTNAAFQATALSSGNHVFVSELDSTGSNLIYSTYLSGSTGVDNATGLALDVRGRAYLTGTTTSTDFPTTTGAFQTTSKATNQFFMSKVDPSLTGSGSLVYSTYIGGSAPASGVTVGGGIAVDTSSTSPSVLLTGGTSFTDMPVLNASQGTNAGGVDAFVAKFIPTNASGTEQIYLTYLGGSGDDTGNGIAVDAGGSAYVTGSTTSSDLPAAGTGPYQPAYGGGASDAFMVKLNNPTSGSSVALTYTTYLGGSGTDVGLAVAVDSLQGARVTGYTDSSNFPTKSSVQASLGGGTDAFAARIDTTATTATAAGHYSTYLGGSGNDRGTGIAVDPQGASYVAGETASSNFPTHNPFQSGLSGSSDAFISKLGATVTLSIAATATPSPTGVGNAVSFKYTITNNGDLTTGITFSDVLPSGATFVSASTSPGSCGTPTGTPSTLTCSIGTLNAGAIATVTVNLTPTVAGSLGNSGTVTVLGSTFTATASASATVSDFSISVAPPSVTVPAGTPATYQVTATPTGAFPNSVSLSCSSGLPAATACAFTNNPIPNLNTGAQSRALNINTTARPLPTAGLAPGRLSGSPLYAAWLPVCGIALLGLRVGRSRKRLMLTGVLLGGFLALILFQAGCGGSSTTPTPTSGTPAGTYTITVTGTSGTAVRTTTLELVVQ